MYSIYRISPTEDNKDVFDFVETFETKEDAEKVLSVLESVNVAFNCYTIIKEPNGGIDV